jgi:redox-sensitive bicupin YhaK (pirin superfamily)
MINIYPAEERFSVDMGWVKSSASFSFGSYFDPDNTQFGVMRVCNDDEISAGRGFGPHPHSDMEVVTVVLEGQIRHEDNLGNNVVTSAGGVQRMSAGTGIIHAEHNGSDTETLRSLQLWFMPRERGLTPSFESCNYDPKQMINRLLPVVTPEGSEHAAKIHQDMILYLGKLDQDNTIDYAQEAERRIYLFVLEGEVKVNDVVLKRRDTARIESVPKLNIKANESAFFMLIDLP